MNSNMQVETSAFMLFSVCTETLGYLKQKSSAGIFSALRALASSASKPYYMLIGR